VAINCAAIPGELMESELFGHERGAFTHAHAAKPGLFEEADGGTLFLDEIGHLPVTLHGKLLRALDDRRIRRVGSTQSREVDVRIIAATHVDLADAVHQGRFREDLFYRLNVVALTLPPLRERGDDIDVLAEYFVQRHAGRYRMEVPRLTDEVRLAIRRHTWPGNVRELQHAIERALLLSTPGTLDPAHLIQQERTVANGRGALPFPATLDTIQTAAVKAALAQHDGNKTAAARQLGISRARLQRLLNRGEN
jgi:transcriptional regulator with PAS, ATPase and Fis domain